MKTCSGEPVAKVKVVTANNYTSLLMICSFAYVAALGVIHWLGPRLETARL